MLSSLASTEPRTGTSSQERCVEVHHGHNRTATKILVKSNDFIREIWKPRPLISAGGYNRETALAVAETKGDLVAFGRYFISNVRQGAEDTMYTIADISPQPDLPLRLKKDLPLTKYDRSHFYTAESEEGYSDYSVAPENVEELAGNVNKALL